MLNQILHLLLKEMSSISLSLSHLLFMELNVFHSQAATANSVCLLVAVFLIASPEDEDDDDHVGHIDVKVGMDVT